MRGRARYVNISKNRKSIYGRLLLKNTTELKMCDIVHIELISTYSKYIRQHKTVVTTTKSDVSLICMIIIDLTMGWFEIFEVTTFHLNEVTGGNYE